MQKINARRVGMTDFYSGAPLYVNNCGLFRALERESRMLRPRGRLDCQLLFDLRGTIRVSGETLSEGEAYLYLPEERQEYVYLPGEETLYYWIHFSGSEVPALLARYSLSPGKLSLSGNSREIEELLRMIIRAFGESWRCADDYAAGLLRSLFSLLAGQKNSGSPFFRAQHLLSDVSETLSVREIAALCGLSEGHFIRQFAAYTGKTPGSYRLACRIDAACELLEGTDLPVSEIAHRLHFEDPLYFSRLFSKKRGVSPREYRRVHRL